MTDDNVERRSARIGPFEWDENKRLLNIEKHGIDFADATEVFSDPSAFTCVSPRSVDESRYVTVGAVRGTLIAVIFTVRGKVIRLISARAARRSEREFYGRESPEDRSEG